MAVTQKRKCCNNVLIRVGNMQHAVVCSELLVQAVYESQPRPDIRLYVAPLGGQATDAVMTLNAQAGKFRIISEVTSSCTCQQVVFIPSQLRFCGDNVMS